MGFRPDAEYDLDELIQRAEEGDMDAADTAASYMIYHGVSDEQPGLYVSILEKMVENDKSVGYIMLGDVYLRGKYVEQNVEYAINLYLKAARKGINFGYECIGDIYYDGKVTEQNYERAFHYYKKIKGRKSPSTLFRLGEMHRNGLFVTKNYRTACIYYRKIVYSKEPYVEYDDFYWQGCLRLGQAYHYGLGVKKDLSLALELVEAADKLFESRGEDAIQRKITGEEIKNELMTIRKEILDVELIAT